MYEPCSDKCWAGKPIARSSYEPSLKNFLLSREIFPRCTYPLNLHSHQHSIIHCSVNLELIDTGVIEWKMKQKIV